MERQRVGKKTNRLRKMNEIANTNLYFFSTKDVDYNRKIISGIFYDRSTKKWVRSEFPFPDVYYSRAGELKNNQNVKRLRATFDEMHIAKINSERYYHKWDSYQELMKYEELHPHLPETKLYKKKSDLEEMFRDSHRLYLKSFRQNNGSGIMSVTEKKDGYEYKYFKKDQLTIGTSNNLTELIKIIKSFFKRKRFIIQKSIDLLAYNNKALDLRCDVQRNGKGELECVSHSVRVAAENSHITNTRTKPNIQPFKEFFVGKLGFTNEEFMKLKTRLEQLLFKVFEKVEESYGSYGEIGIDIGIDKNGGLWLIECNMMPGKNSLWVNDEKTIDRAFLNPLEYAKFLAKA
ncbi:YheC/YheD family protein [Cytobacillus suaedae]|nr:YheC/YheD family protein [Cytobacillus suaedae]